MDTTPVNYIALCAGYDGIGLGLAHAGVNLRTIAYVEIEAFAIASLVAKAEAGAMACAPIWTDLKTFPFGEFHSPMEHGLLSAGFPCQPFSQNGSRRTTEDSRHLWPHIANGITACRPRYVFLENVEGIISAKCRNQPGTPDGTSVLLYVLQDLESRGYRTTWGIFSASECGATHRRKRVYILADSHRSGRSEDPQQGELWSSSPVQPSLHRGHNLPATPRKDLPGWSWPNWPYQPQHGWECPRSQPRLGRTVNGPASKVDRLRLLGNGVVPATASVAWQTLSRRLSINLA